MRTTAFLTAASAAASDVVLGGGSASRRCGNRRASTAARGMRAGLCTQMALGLLVTLAGANALASDVLIRGARVYTVAAQGTLDSADVLVHDDKIAAVGTGLTAPSGATIIDAKGRTLTPGFFGGLSAIGLEDVELEDSTNEESLAIKAPFHEAQLRPEFDPTMAFNPRSVVVPITRIEGVTWTVLSPGVPVFGGGNFLTGQGSAVTLDGRFDAALAGSRSLFVDVGSDTFSISGGSLAAQFMLLDQAVRETRSPGAAGEHALLTPAGREALGHYLSGGRVVFHVQRAADIRQAVAFAKRNHMKPVIAGGVEAWVVADELAKDKVPVVLCALEDLPADFDRIGARLDNAALLHKAGVEISFMLNDEPTHNARKLRQTAGIAVAHGLPFDAALAGLTANPAEIFGLGATRGHIARGQVADLVLWTGDPLEVSTLADRVWIAGRAVDMHSRQTELRDRYLERLRQNQAR